MIVISCSATELLVLLDKVEARINSPEKWCKGTFASNGKMEVSFNDPSACQFCIVGATLTEMGHDRWLELKEVLRESLNPIDWQGSLSTFNDLPETTHADVMNLFQRARETLQKEIAA